MHPSWVRSPNLCLTGALNTLHFFFFFFKLPEQTAASGGITTQTRGSAFAKGAVGRLFKVVEQKQLLVSF